MKNPTPPYLSRTVESLLGLSASERFWYCLQLNPESTVPRLLLRSLAEDPKMQELLEDASELPAPEGSVSSIGLGYMSYDGRIQLSGTQLSREFLQQLAAWVCQEVEQVPALARLKNTELLRLNKTGLVEETFCEPSLWESVPEVSVPGSQAESVERLRRLRPGRNCWFWLAEKGPGRRPFLYLSSALKDPTGERFASIVMKLRRKSGEQGFELKGIARKTSAGTVLLTTSEPIDGARALLSSLGAAEPTLAPLLTSVVVAKSGAEKFVQAKPFSSQTPTADLSTQSAVLKDLDTQSKVLFWFGFLDGQSEPLLLLNQDKGALRDAVAAAGSWSRGVRGHLSMSKNGWPSFQARKPFPDFITALAGWVCRHAAQWPALHRLSGARMICRDTEGQIIDKQRDADAWKKLTN